MPPASHLVNLQCNDSWVGGKDAVCHVLGSPVGRMGDSNEVYLQLRGTAAQL